MSIRINPLLGALLLIALMPLATCGSSFEPGRAIASSDGLIILRASAPGALPQGVNTTIGGVPLGSGHLVRNAGLPQAPPVAWLSGEPVDLTTWVAVAEQFPTTGLWPVMVDGMSATEGGSGLDRPWLDGEFGPVETADGIDVDDFLAESWDWVSEDFPTQGPWPGLATGTAVPPELRIPAGFDDGSVQESGLLLVPVTRPADVVAALGWFGATNYHSSGQVSAVLRSWEDRFGAVIMFLNFDSVFLVVQQPPRTATEIDHVAAEHAAFIPDMIWQESESYGAYRDALDGNRGWLLWWD